MDDLTCATNRQTPPIQTLTVWALAAKETVPHQKSTVEDDSGFAASLGVDVQVRFTGVAGSQSEPLRCAAGGPVV